MKNRARAVPGCGTRPHVFSTNVPGQDSPFVAIPVFPNHAFRHSTIYVNRASGIEKPEDLNGKTIGELPLYSHDAGIMLKGMLMEEYGFQPETCNWIIGGWTGR